MVLTHADLFLGYISSKSNVLYNSRLIFLGYKSTTAQLLSVPPYAAGCLLTILIGLFSDRTKMRGLSNIGVSLIGIAGFSMLLGAKSPGVRYAGTFLGAMGIYPCIPNTISWASNNTEGKFPFYPVVSITLLLTLMYRSI